MRNSEFGMRDDHSSYGEYDIQSDGFFPESRMMDASLNGTSIIPTCFQFFFESCTLLVDGARYS